MFNLGDSCNEKISARSRGTGRLCRRRVGAVLGHRFTAPVDLNGTLRQELTAETVASRSARTASTAASSASAGSRIWAAASRPASTCCAGVNPDTGTGELQVLEPSFDGQPVQQHWRTAPRPRLHADVLEPDDLRRVRLRTASAARSTSARLRQRPSRQLDRLLPAGQPGRLLRPGHGGRCRERHERRQRPARYIGGQCRLPPPVRSTSLAAYAEAKIAPRIVHVSRAAATRHRSMPAGETQKTWNVGGSWDFGFMKLMGYYDEDKITDSARRRSCSDQRRDPVRSGRSPHRLRRSKSGPRTAAAARQVDRAGQGDAASTTSRSGPRCTARLRCLKNKDDTARHAARHARRCADRTRAATRRASRSACVTSSDRTLASRELPSRAQRPPSGGLFHARPADCRQPSALARVLPHCRRATAQPIRSRRAGIAASTRGVRFASDPPSPCSPSSSAASCRPSS